MIVASEHTPTSAMKAMWAAVVGQAIEDAFNPSCDPHEHYTALSWMMAKSGDYARDRRLTVSLAGLDCEAFDDFAAKKFEETKHTRSAWILKGQVRALKSAIRNRTAKITALTRKIQFLNAQTDVADFEVCAARIAAMSNSVAMAIAARRRDTKDLQNLEKEAANVRKS